MTNVEYTSDRVAVVRCKDCISYDDEPGGTIKMCYCGLGWTSPNDYCSKGLRVEKMNEKKGDK